MANDVNIELLGVDEINKILDNLPKKLTRKFVLASWRRSAKPLISAARSNTPKDKGDLAKSIGNITGRSKKYPTIYVGPRAGKSRTYDGFYGKFIEFGTKFITAKPFMRPAIASTIGAVKDNFYNAMRVVMQKTVDKYNTFKGI